MRTKLVSACILLLAGSALTLPLKSEPAEEEESYLILRPGAPDEIDRLNSYIVDHAPSDSLEDNFRTIRELATSKEFADEGDETFHNITVMLARLELNPQGRCKIDNLETIISILSTFEEIDYIAFRGYKSGHRLLKLLKQYFSGLHVCFDELAEAWAQIKPEDLEERHGGMKVFDVINGEDYPENIRITWMRSTTGCANLKDEEIYKIAHHVARAEYGQQGLKFNNETGMDDILTRKEAENLLQLAMYKRCEGLDDIEPILNVLHELAKWIRFPAGPITDNERSMLQYASRYFTCITVKELPIKDAARGLINYQLSLRTPSPTE